MNNLLWEATKQAYTEFLNISKEEWDILYQNNLNILKESQKKDE